MTFWDGTRWVPNARAVTISSSAGWRRFASAITEAALAILILTLIVVALSPWSPAAKFIAGAGVADAATKQTYELNYSGYTVWGDPYALADFLVTRVKVDRTDVWVKADCVDSSGAQAIPGADPYAVVAWDADDPLVGLASLDSVKKGSTCEVWLTKSFKQSTGPAPGWPETNLEVSW